MILRDYQEQCLTAIFDQWTRVRSTAAVLATGLGKTVIFANAIQRLGKRALVIAHRKELIRQAVETIQKSTDLQCAVEMGWERADSDLFTRHPVVVATVQSLNSGTNPRMLKWNPNEFGLIVCDEFHHGTSDSYRRIFDNFPEAKILGVTATPDRADEEALSQICESVAFTFDILDGCSAGWLVPITQQFCPVSSLDFSEVHSVAGDLNQGELAEVMQAKKNVEGIVQPTLEVLFGLPPKTLTPIPIPEWRAYLTSLPQRPRRGIVFTVSVLQAEQTCELLNAAVPGIAEWVCGATDTDTRDGILKRFARGETSVVVNCGVLTEGYDNPAVEVIFMARPTKSRSLYTQMVGRSTRTLPGTIDGLITAEERIAAIAASAKQRCRVIDFVGNSGRHKLICALDILSGKCSLQAVERAIAKAKAEGKPVTVLKQLSNEELKLKSEREQRRKPKLVPKSDFRLEDVDPFGGRSHHQWQPTKQIANPATFPQRRVIARAGINPNGWSKKQAGMIISILVANHWRLPADPKYDWIRNHGKAKVAA